MNNKIITLVLLISLSVLMNANAQENPQTPEKEIYAKIFIGKKAPALHTEGWIIEAPKTKGKFVLIDVWATWCGPCRRAIPELNEWHHKYSDKLVIIGISDENKEKILKMQSPIIEYPNAYDTQARFKKALEVRGIPHVLVLNPDGIVVWQGFPQLPGHELNAAVLEKLIGWK